MPIGALNLLGFAALAAVLAVVAHTALFVEGSLRLGTGHAGLSIRFSALGWMLGSAAANRLQERIGGYSVITVGLALVSLTLLFGLVVFDQGRPVHLGTDRHADRWSRRWGIFERQFTTLHSLTLEIEMGRISSNLQ